MALVEIIREVDLSDVTGPAKVVYRLWDDWRINRILDKAETEGISLIDLERSHHRIAFLMRVQRAVEVCSSKEVVDYLADVLIGSIKSGDVDKRPDFAQMAVSALSGVTKIELDVVVEMHKAGIYLPEEYATEDHKKMDAFYENLCEKLNISALMLGSIVNGLSKTGLVSPPASGIGGILARNTNQLTPLARELFHYVDHARRLT